MFKVVCLSWYCVHKFYPGEVKHTHMFGSDKTALPSPPRHEMQFTLTAQQRIENFVKYSKVDENVPEMKPFFNATRRLSSTNFKFQDVKKRIFVLCKTV